MISTVPEDIFFHAKNLGLNIFELLCDSFAQYLLFDIANLFENITEMAQFFDHFSIFQCWVFIHRKRIPKQFRILPIT